ncbi:MAG: tetratricopeptide repeat protein [Bacteroidia bacterium]|nr:tetratricopeptide repeat protein [Bacteroidia bacterium]
MQKFFIVLIFLVFIGCSPSSDQMQDKKESERADSIALKLNSKELKNINDLLRNQPSNPDLYYQRGVIYRKLGLWKESENDLKRAIKLDSTKVEYFMELSDMYFASNQSRKSKETLESVTKKFPNHAPAYLKLGELYFIVRQYKEASDMVNAAIRLEPDNADAYFLRGNIFREAGDTSRSISSFQTATELNPENTDAWYDLGLMYYHKKNPLSLEIFRKCLNMKKSVRNLYAFGSALQRFQKYDDALKIFDTILKIQPREPAALFNKGAILADVKNRYDEAAAIFETIISFDSTNVRARLARAWCMENLGKKKSAIEEYKKVLKIEPNQPKAVEALNRLQ